MSKCKILFVGLRQSITLLLVYLLSWFLRERKNSETGWHSGICLTHIPRSLSLPDSGQHFSWGPRPFTVSFWTPCRGSDIPCSLPLVSRPLHMLLPLQTSSTSSAWQRASCHSGFSCGVTPSRKPPLISPGPGCVLPQHNAVLIYLGTSQQWICCQWQCIRDPGSVWVPGEGERQDTAKPTLLSKAGRCLFSVLGPISRDVHLICLSEWIPIGTRARLPRSKSWFCH